jgi:RNA polymerase sigma-70 factor (ECF subfamily)
MSTAKPNIPNWTGNNPIAADITESAGPTDSLCVADHDRSIPASDLWSVFEAEAMPHVDRLFRLAMWLERDRQEADELVQETLLQALRSFHRFTAGTNCKAWLITILQHTRSNRRRARFRREAVEAVDDRIADTAAFVPPIPAFLTDESVLAALEEIPEPYQRIILLSDVEELTYKEIANALGIPMGTVMSRLHRGRILLRKALVAQGVVGGQRASSA